jgi:choline monooxygenase
VQRMNTRLNTTVHEEDVDLVENVQAGLATRGYRPGPLSGREAAVGWFAGRVRADLAADTTTGELEPSREPEPSRELAGERAE